MLKKVLSLLIFIPTLVMASESDLYDFLWLDPDKSVYVLQNKIYPKDKSFYVDIGYVSNLTSNFQDTQGAQLKAGYYLNEEWAVEFDYMQYTNTDNTAFDSLQVITSTEPFIRRPLQNATVFLIWSPFYGKINTFNKIYYFDWSFGVGTGQYTMESSLKFNTVGNGSGGPGNGPNQYETENFTPLQLKSNVKFHINKHIHLGVEFLNTNYQAATPKSPNTDKWQQNNDLIFSIGVSF